MGICARVNKKRGQNNTIITINKLKSNVEQNTTNNNNIQLLKLIITESLEESKPLKQNRIEIEPFRLLLDLCRLLHMNTDNEYDIILNDNQLIENVNKYKNINDILNPYIKDNNDLNNYINLTFIYRGLHVAENIIESYISKNPIIGSPIFDNPDNFGVITFNTKNKELKFFNYEQKNLELPLLSKFNSFTAYCNANGFLYISGGENEQSDDLSKSITEYNDFFCIDLNQLTLKTNLNNNEIISENENDNDNVLTNILTNMNEKNELNIKQLPNLLEPRTWHSMIFVPEKYIFIVGGSSKNVEIYDIELNSISKDGELNEMRNECTLCMVNNIYLYAFCGFLLHQTFNCSVERCNLRKKKRTWEYVNYNSNYKLQFNPSFFCVSYFKEDKILLVGGNDSVEEKNKSYIVKIGMDENPLDEINEFNNFSDENIGVFRDKLFTPINNDYAVNIPMMSGENIQLLFLNMKTGDIEKKIYDNIINDFA